MNKLPKSKTDNLVIQDFNDEILIYNLADNKAFCLNQTSAIVYQACDGETTIDELKIKSSLPEDLIHLTLLELERNKFIEMPANYISPLIGMSRREAVRKVGLATMIALPVISSLIAPTATTAASRNVCIGTCFAPNQNICVGRQGQTINYTFYNSIDGSCSGNIGATVTLLCPATEPVIAAPDICRA